jgi:mucin-19
MTRGKSRRAIAPWIWFLLLLAGGAKAVPVASVSFSPSTIGVGDTSTLTITINNGDAAAYTGLSFTDTYPGNLSNATPSNSQSNCGGTLTGGAAGGNSVGLSGAGIAAGSSCSITLTVTSTVAASYTTTTGLITTAAGGTGTAAGAGLLVVSKPAAVKIFSPTSTAPGVASTLTLSVTNSNSTALSGVAFTDNFPAGLVVAATPAISSSNCGATPVGVPGGAAASLSGGVIAAGATCVVSVPVSSATSNIYINTASGVSATQFSGAGAASNAASLNVLQPPAIAMSFAPNPTVSGITATLTVTLTNPNSVALTGAAFSVNYPALVNNVLFPGLTNTCTGGTAIGASAGTSVSLSGAGIPANSSCSVSVGLASGVNGNYTFTSTAVTSTNGGTGATAASTLVVAPSPFITKSFTPAKINVGGTSTLTFTLSNIVSLGLFGITFSDALPAGLVVAGTPALSNTCNGTITGATANSTSIALSGGTIGLLSQCVISVNVTSSTAGAYLNTTGVLSTSAGSTGATSNTATLQVVKPASVAKSFSVSPIRLGASSTLSLTITNPNGIALTGVALADTFPANLTVSSTPLATNSCGGTLSGATAGSGSLSLSGGALAAGPGSTCVISIQVTSNTLGSYNNTSGGVSAVETTAGAASNTATLVVAAPDLRVSKSHSGNFTVGTNGVYTVTVDNGLGGISTTGTITVVDVLPAGLAFVATGSGGTGWSCSSSGQTVTCTSSSVIAAGGTAPVITINVAVAAIAVPSVVNSVAVSGGGEAAANTTNNLAADYTLVATAAQSTLSTDGRQTSTAGTVVFYAHIFTAGFAGNVLFSSSDQSSPSVVGWSSALFKDTNCNGILDGSEGGTVLSGSVAVAAGGQVCIIDKVFIPANVGYGAQDQTTITAAFTPTSTGAAATLTRLDLTTVGSVGGAGLSLNKTVRNVTTGEVATANDSAASGQTLEYTITYGNNGAGSLNVIVINDTTPNFTRFVSAQCVTPLPAALSACSVSTAPAVTAQGNLAWTLTGALQSNATGSVALSLTAG